LFDCKITGSFFMWATQKIVEGGLTEEYGRSLSFSYKAL
jgi:hypothetical protein